MSFAGILRQIVEECGGGIGAALMGNDGIAIAQVTAAQEEGGLVAEEIATAGTEFGRILEEIRKASDAVAGGAVMETTIRLSRVTLLFRSVDQETFLVVALLPDGNVGKARYLIRRQLLALRQEL
jgi:predicted regulator of Ras-like GTPase activity (Roadblock/LC7/MglB family)